MRTIIGFFWPLNLWSAVTIILAVSLIVVFLDGYVVKPMRTRKWERKAESGDEEARELLRVARSAKVVDE